MCRDILIIMAVALVCYLSPGEMNAQIYTPEPLSYRGEIDGQEIEVLLEYLAGHPIGLLYWPGEDQVFGLRQTGRNDTFAERDLFRGQPTGRTWSIRSQGSTLLLTAPGGRLYTLSEQPIRTDPYLLDNIPFGNRSAAVAFFQLCKHFTGIREDLLFYGGNVATPHRTFQLKDVAFFRKKANLFGNAAEELLIELRIGTYIHVLRTFQQKANGWDVTPTALFFKRNHRDAEPCLVEPPGPAYFHYDLAEVRRPGEYLLYGYVYDGHCAGIYRGDDIFFYVWQATDAGFKALFHAPARSYWYASPDPAPIEQPVFQEFIFVSQKSRGFPLRLSIRSARYAWPDGVERGTTLQPTGFATQVVSLF